MFGLNCSPFLIGTSIKYHMEQYYNKDFNSEITEKFLWDLYMHNSISSSQKENA